MADKGRLQQLIDVQEEARAVFRTKNADYGDAFAEYGPVGVLVRLGDKVRRLQTVAANGITMVPDEGMRDTLLDMHNYAAMAIMLVDESAAGAQAPSAPERSPPCIDTLSDVLFETDGPAQLVSSIFYPEIDPATCQTVIDSVMSSHAGDRLASATMLHERLDALRGTSTG